MKEPSEVAVNGLASQALKSGASVSHGVSQMLSSKAGYPASQQKPMQNGSSSSSQSNPTKMTSSSSQLPQQQQQQPQQQQRTVSPAYSDISDEEPETSAPLVATVPAAKPGDSKQSLINVRRDKSADPRAPLDLTQPSYDAFRPSLLHPQHHPQQQQQQQHHPFQMAAHLGQSPMRFPPPPGLPTSTPSLNILHSIMASAKFQELQQAMASVPGAMRSLPPSVASSQPLSIPSISKSSPYLKPPSGLPPPPSLRPELSHSHLLGAGYPVTSSGTKMAAMAAAAEAAKRSVTPVSSSIPLPMHLSPFAAGNKIQSLFALPFFKIYSAKFLFMFTIQ